jgi:hypothetical protein
MIDKILTEAGFAPGPDALTSLTNALHASGKPPVASDGASTADGKPPHNG